MTRTALELVEDMRKAQRAYDDAGDWATEDEKGDNEDVAMKLMDAVLEHAREHDAEVAALRARVKELEDPNSPAVMKMASGMVADEVRAALLKAKP